LLSKDLSLLHKMRLESRRRILEKRTKAGVQRQVRDYLVSVHEEIASPLKQTQFKSMQSRGARNTRLSQNLAILGQTLPRESVFSKLHGTSPLARQVLSFSGDVSCPPPHGGRGTHALDPPACRGLGAGRLILWLWRLIYFAPKTPSHRTLGKRSFMEWR
jgi:hypothetical protein